MSAVDLKLHGKDVLFVVRIDSKVFGDCRADSKLVGGSGVNPFADLVGFGSHFRQVVHLISLGDAGCASFSVTILLDEGNGIDNLVTAVNNGGEGFVHDCFSGDFGCCTLLHPFVSISGSRRDSRKLITNLGALLNLNCLRLTGLIGISSGIEGDRNHFRRVAFTFDIVSCLCGYELSIFGDIRAATLGAFLTVAGYFSFLLLGQVGILLLRHSRVLLFGQGCILLGVFLRSSFRFGIGSNVLLFCCRLDDFFSHFF